MRSRLPIFLFAAGLAMSLPGLAAASTESAFSRVEPAIPRPPAQDAIWLSGVTATSPSDVWTVGGWYANPRQSLAAHWDGTNWTVFPAPVITSQSLALEAVDAVSSSDVWAAGHYSNWDGSTATALIAHFDGTAWSAVPIVPPGSKSSSYWLSDLDMVSAGEGWAVGRIVEPGASEIPLLLRWHDGQWNRIRLPGTSSSVPSGALPGLPVLARLETVHARSANDVWAVGYEGRSALVLHWDGIEWSRASVPHDGPVTAENHLFAAAAVSATEVWAAGKSCMPEADPGYSECHPIVLHLSGGTWQVRRTVGAGSTQLLEVVARSANDVWLVGYDRVAGVEGNHVQHWDGQGFTIVPSVPAAAAGSFGTLEGLASALGGATVIPGTGELWAVGWTRDSAGIADTQVIRHD